MQKSWQDDPQYKDTEFVVYHYPERYFEQIRGGERFVYYRPSRGARAVEASSYFGCGELGDPFPDADDASHRFVGINKPIRFPQPVPYLDASGQMYESRFTTRSPFQGQSIRYIDDLDYYRILAAAGLTGETVSSAPTVNDVLAGLVSAGPAPRPPLDELRPLLVVPAGTGYRPTGNGPDIFESAALQERARGDHQDTLRLLKNLVEAKGGVCLFNNNIDLLAQSGERRMLVEVKSLVNASASVDRMRYGMGQLFDYSVRYRAKIGNASPVLAFGTPLRRDVSWINEVLDGNGVASVMRDGNRLIPTNTAAKALPIFQ
jgi:hypothetical protein